MKVLLIFAVSYCCISVLMAQDPVILTTTVPTTVTTTDTASTTITTPMPSDPVEYCKGKGVGRFTWPRDDTCKTYVYCFVQSSTGSLTGAIYTCAGTTTFNPTLQMCDTSKAIYPVKPTTTVPTTVTTTTTASTTTTTASTTTTTASTTTTTASTTTTTASTTTTTPIPSDPVEYCKGKGVGRYTWPRDDTCKTYVYCFVQSSTGSLTGAIYTCAGTTTFNPTLQLCDTSKAVCK